MTERRQAGSAVLEAVIAAPVIMLLVVFLIGAGRIAGAHQLVDDAAGVAARAASQARSIPAANLAARQAANDSLDGRGLSCSAMSVSLDVSDWRPGGSVGATVTCTAQLADLGLALLGPSRTISARAASVIDIYRQVAP